MTDQDPIYNRNHGWADGLDAAEVAYHLQRAEYAKTVLENRDRLTDRDRASLSTLNGTIHALRKRHTELERGLAQ